MARRVFVDAAWNSKPHVCYDLAENKFFEVNDLRELIGRYDEVYVDSALFPNMWPQLRALIDNDIRVFYFAWPWKWKELREKYAEKLKRKFGKKKTDYGDAYILSKIHGKPKAFREVTPLDVKFKPLLMIERTLHKEIKRLESMQMLGIDVEDEIENRAKELRRVRERIVEMALERIPQFGKVAEKLGLNSNNSDVDALSALAGLLIYLKWPYRMTSTHKAIRYLGLYKPTRENVRKFEERYGEEYKRRYSGHARRFLNLLATSVLRKNKGVFPPKAKDEKELLRKLLNVLRDFNKVSVGGGAG